MSTIVISFDFNAFIGKKESANFFFNLLESEGLLPDKIGLYEPLKENFTRERAIDMWLKTETGNGRIIGSMMGKKKNPSYSFIMGWNKGERFIRPNWLTVFVPTKIFKKNQKKFMQIFIEIQQEFDGLYGYISIEEVQKRQFVPGNIETRLPGIFWCNYFSRIYVDFFSEEKLLNGPWIKREMLPNGAILTFLANDPDGELVEDEGYEKNAKTFLGEGSFGDSEYYLEHLDEVQLKSVPKLELEEIRVTVTP
ncbi:hypothetical protein KZ483_06185 [Paenibacillus sp. sptzw28]|uniref:hypothetical protein n=1 Tax=Paenibacillus sp. sptzw28 TaxID=715179 RepID=UPI001C6EB06E|nr:hypothetical protein [Paenibacillus sp. sptzw28]QYR22554.1 hypothetical protein KZ483_06185 [Paenibacillus sp. sptzw28]